MGQAMKIDESLRKQAEAILAEYGLINSESEMTREKAARILFSELEKGVNSGRSPLTHKQVWGKFDL